MKFLVDRCAGRRLAEWLRQEGHAVVESRERGRDPGDRTLLDWAAAEGRVLVTIDTDFGKLVFADRMPHCGVVRLPDVPAARRLELMRRVLGAHAADLEAGAIVTVRGGRIRVSWPPR
jgi:predicted nuclease of predicted toxin-antitoxin system